MQLLVEVNSGNVAAVIAALEGTTAKKKRGRPPKVEVEADETEESEEEDEADEGEETEEEDEGEETEEEDEADEEDEKPTAGKKVKQADVVKAFQAYAGRHSREKAKKILAKYKAKNVAALPAAKYPEIMKLLAK